MSVIPSLLAGLIAGLALAAPLGAIGVLLIQEGVTRGWRRGLASAAAVATVDILYCVAAVVAGTAAAGALASTVAASWAPWPQIIGGVALIAIGVHGLARSGRRVAAGESPQHASGGDSGGRRYALFLGLTALNPATLVFFAAILTGLGSVTESAATAGAFVVGVGVASFGWQTLLVALGAGLRHTTGHAFRRWTAVVGNSVVVILGALLLVRAL